MGWFGSLFFSKQITQLEDFKKTLSDPDEIAQVNKTIAILKDKEAARNDK